MRKTIVPVYFIVISMLLILSSCATFKPDYYNSETRTYNNYQKNYAVKVSEDFSFTKKDSLKDPISKSYMTQFPMNTKILYDKDSPIFIVFFELAQTSISFVENFKENMYNDVFREYLKKTFLKTFNTKNVKIENLKLDYIDDFINFEYLVTSEIVNSNQQISLKMYLIEQRNPKGTLFISSIICFPSHEEVAKERYLEFIKGVRFNPFSQEERYK